MRTAIVLKFKRRAVKARLDGYIAQALHLEESIDRWVSLMKPAQRQRCEDALTEMEGEL
jgi:hypothetical protein